MSTYFVTATGTDIGKTFVTAGLVRALRAADRPVEALKPIASGFDMAIAATSDAGQLLAAMERPITGEALDAICPWRFAAPLSPDMAAMREGRTIGFDALLGFCRERMKSSKGTLFIEGVGGVMVPLDNEHTVLDWMTALGAPAIVVAGTYLGTISHTLTALDVLGRARVRVGALVLNDSGDGAVPLEETKATLLRFAPGVPVAVVPRVKSYVAARDAFAQLTDML